MTASPQNALLFSGLSALFVVGGGMAIFGPALPVYERAFGISTQTSGLLVSTLWTGCLGGVLAMFFKGAQIAPRLPLALLVIGAVLLALAPLWSVVLVGALIFGLGYGGVAALFNPRVLVTFGPTGAAKLGMLNAMFSLGAILAPWGFAQFSGDLRPVFWAIAGLSGLTWVFAGPVGMTGVANTGAARGVRVHLPILAFAVIGIGIEASLAGLGPTALIRAGTSEEAAAALLSLFFVAALGTRVVLILTAHRFSDFSIYVFAIAFAAACALGAALVSPAFFFPPMGVSAGLFFQGAYVTATRKMGDDPRVSPVIMAMGLLGAIFSPPIYSQFMDGFGIHGFFWLVAGVAGLATLAALTLYRGMMR